MTSEEGRPTTQAKRQQQCGRGRGLLGRPEVGKVWRAENLLMA